MDAHHRKNLLPFKGNGRRIAVAMSGGVDSSVVAALLRDADFDVIGLTMQLTPKNADSDSTAKTCCAGRDQNDARRVAEKLNIRHYVLDYRQTFTKHVLEDFALSYLDGKTPLPCVRCNQKVKFGDLLYHSRQLGCCGLATGHYVRQVYHQNPNGMNESSLYRAVDASRDQSYFLFTTTREQLQFLHFPLGGLQKSTVRRLARHYGLTHVADKPDSQDLCFVPKGHYRSVINAMTKTPKQDGIITDKHGRVLGKHDGIIGYTVGQRRRLAINATQSDSKPWYVTAIDSDNNRLIVGKKEDLAHHQLTLDHVNWLGSQQAFQNTNIPIKVRLRSSADLLDATISLAQCQTETVKAPVKATVALCQPTERTAEGQACVFYSKNQQQPLAEQPLAEQPLAEQLLGGGWIT